MADQSNLRDDSCLRRPVRKEATSGVRVFLQEELGDARLRCTQLKGYIDQAISLIEKSEQRDQFFEVAGNLIHSIPDTLLRLDKSLSATAMAVARWDYEELKDELLPEKVDELEAALDDTRVRRVVRRTQQAKDSRPMKRSDAADRLNKIAANVEAGSALDVDAVAALISDLEGPRVKTASTTGTIAKELRVLARNLSKRGSKLTPMKAAQLLRGLLTFTAEAGHVKSASEEFVADDMTASDEVFADTQPMANEESLASEAKRSRFETNKSADPTMNMDPEDADKWKVEHLENKDNFTEGSPKEAGEDFFDKAAIWKVE